MPPVVVTRDSPNLRERLNPHYDDIIAAVLDAASDAHLAYLDALPRMEQDYWRHYAWKFIDRLNPDKDPQYTAFILAREGPELLAINPDVPLDKARAALDAMLAARPTHAPPKTHRPHGKRAASDDSDDSDDPDAAGAPRPRQPPRSVTESMAEAADVDLQAALLASLRAPSPAAGSRPLTAEHVYQPSFGHVDVGREFRRRGIDTHPRWDLSTRKRLLVLLLLDLPPHVVVAAFAEEGVAIVLP